MRTIFLGLLVIPACSSAQWQQITEFPGTARDNACSFVIGENVYVGTGREDGFVLTADWYRYNTISNSWTQVASLPATGRQWCTSFSMNNKGYLVGGHVYGMSSAEVWAYDPAMDEWEQQDPLPEPMNRSTAFVLADGPHIVSGILSNDLPSNLHVRLDTVSGTWATLVNVPGIPMHNSSSFAHGGAGYVLGGADVVSYDLDEVWRFDPVNGIWEARASLPSGRFNGNAVELEDGGVFVNGVSNLSVPTGMHDDVWRYHAASDIWEILPAFPAGGRGGAVIAKVNGSIYYGTGSTSLERFQDWWRLDLPVTVPEEVASRGTPYPDPTEGTVHLERCLLPSDRKVVLLDGNGRSVRSWTPTQTSIDLGGVAAGSYLLRLEGSTVRHHPLLVIP